MTDHDFRDLFARLDEAPDPRPEFVERLLRDFDAIAAPPGTTPDPPATTVHGPTGPDGPPREPGYLVAPEDHQMVALARPHAHRRRGIAVMAAVAAVIGVTVAVAVTRPSAYHQPEPPVAPPPSPAPTAQLQLYWRDGDGIGRSNVDGTDKVDPLIPLSVSPFLCGPAVDQSYVYWTTPDQAGKGGTLGRAKRDGTGVVDSFITTNPYPPGCIAVDGAHIYWTGYNIGTRLDTIGRANLDGTGVQESFISGISGGCGLAVDATHLYWAQNGGVGRANLDGTGVSPDFIAGLGASSSPGPWCGVVVDGAHIYWGNHNGTIGRANLDGTDANESFITGPSMSSLLLLPCAVDNDYLYWALISANRPADPPSPWIGRARLDGTDVQAHFINVQPDSGGCAIGR